MNALEILEADHQRVLDLFEDLDACELPKERRRLLDEIRQELTIHMELEEKMLYPLFQNEESGMESIVLDSLDEHQEVKDLLEDLTELSMGEEEFLDRIEELEESVIDHVDVEESVFFPKIEDRMSDEELQEIGNKMELERRRIESDLSQAA